MGEDSWLMSLVFGGIVIIFFAWDQFKRPSYGTSQDLRRLVELLAPTDLRNGPVYLTAYLLYAGIILGLYLILCIYSNLPILDLLGFDGANQPEVGGTVGAEATPREVILADEPVGASFEQTSFPAAEIPNAPVRNPEFPLYISLMMVGLAPAVPILRKVEEKIRLAAHRMSGIPTRILLGARILSDRPIDLGAPVDDNPGTRLLIPAKDWARLARYRVEAERQKAVDDPEEFLEDINKIIALQSWVIRGKLQFDSGAAAKLSPGIRDLTLGLSTRVEQLLFALDAITGFDTEMAMFASGAETSTNRAAWDKIESDARQLQRDLCMLVMLYSEHGIIPTEHALAQNGAQPTERAVTSAESPSPEATDTAASEAEGVARQRTQAFALFYAFFGDAAMRIDEGTVQMAIWWRCTIVTAVTAAFWGYFVGKSPQVGEVSQLVIGRQYFTTALLTYSLSVLVALSLHQAWYQTNRYKNIFEAHWARWIGTMVGIFLVSAFTAVTCFVAYDIVRLAQTPGIGWAKVADNAPGIVANGLQLFAPGALRGPLLGFFLILAMDGWRASKPTVRLPPIGLVPTHGFILWSATLVMFLWGLVSQVLTRQIQKSLIAPDTHYGFWEVAVEPGTQAIEIGLLTAFIGFVVVGFTLITLREDYPRNRIAEEMDPQRSRLDHPTSLGAR